MRPFLLLAFFALSGLSALGFLLADPVTLAERPLLLASSQDVRLSEVFFDVKAGIFWTGRLARDRRCLEISSVTPSCNRSFLSGGGAFFGLEVFVSFSSQLMEALCACKDAGSAMLASCFGRSFVPVCGAAWLLLVDGFLDLKFGIFMVV